MDQATRRLLAHQALGGYVSGPNAPLRAAADALAKAASAQAMILVEGISDQIALETLATRCHRNLDAEAVAVLPVGGAQAIGQYLRRFGPEGANLPMAGLCDAGEEELFRRSLSAAGLGAPETRFDMRQLGFHVCVDDLEDELIRAAGTDRIEELFDTQGDLGSFRTLQAQPAWRTKSLGQQMRRFLGSGARRKLRYARLIITTLDLHQMPPPLTDTLASV